MSLDNVFAFPNQGAQDDSSGAADGACTVAETLEFGRVMDVLASTRAKAVRRRKSGFVLVQGERS